MRDIKDCFLQTNNIEYVNSTLGTEQWTQVCGHKDMNGADAGFWCGLINLDNLDTVFTDVSWDVSPNHQGVPGFEGNGLEYTYHTNLLGDGMESLLIYRDFYGVKDDYVELSQEFILLNNLRYDSNKKSFWAMYESGESEEAVRYTDNCTVLIKMKFLHRYAAAKRMAIILYYDMRVELEGKLSDYGIEETNVNNKTQTLYYGFWNGEMNFPNSSFSVLMGKKIIMPGPIESCDIWPYERPRTYENFVIGVDDVGKEIEYTCNPDCLANYFGANPTAPMYLTPVFFKKEVLQKYISKPELYEVRDGYLGCQHLWGIEIDNHHKNSVAVYLGDLGRDLPECEQAYWKSFNIVGEEGLSEESLKRDFFNLPADSSMEDHKFQKIYAQLSKLWEDKYGWRLFLPLTDGDQYNLSQIRIPISNSQPEYDQLVLALVKVLIDSLNEKMLQSQIQNTEADMKGISKLEQWLEENGATGYQTHIQFLRDLQELRSSGTGHRKGKSYDKIAAKFQLNTMDFIDSFEDILRRANSFMEFMKESFCQ